MTTIDLKTELDAAILAMQRISEELGKMSMGRVGDFVLDVPWFSQLGAGADYAPGDCGAACVAMVAQFFGPALKFTVDDVSQETGKGAGFSLLSASELARAARPFGVELKYSVQTALDKVEDLVRDGKPVIALVNYALLPKRKDPNYVRGHYVVVVGIEDNSVVYHDPYWAKSEDGAFIKCQRITFEVAFNTPALGNSYGGHAAWPI